jgi:polar amino acid transport system substrate-binding protein
MVGDPLFKNDVFGIGVSKSNPQLRDALVKTLNDLIKSGDYGKLLAKWGLTKNAIPAITVNGVK